MNVEQMIQDGKQQFMESRAFSTSSQAFEAGVRHAIAALFPVVSVEELVEDGKWYLGRSKIGWEPVRCSCGTDEYGNQIEKSPRENALLEMAGSETLIGWHRFTEFRRCPTPDEMGVG